MEARGCDTEIFDLTMVMEKYNEIDPESADVQFFREKLLEAGTESA